MLGRLVGAVVSVAACGPWGHEFFAPLCSSCPVRREQLTTVIAVMWRASVWYTAQPHCRLFTHLIVPRPTRPSMPPWSVNEDQLTAGKAKSSTVHSIRGYTRGCTGKTVKSLDNACRIWALLQWGSFTKGRYIRSMTFQCLRWSVSYKCSEVG